MTPRDGGFHRFGFFYFVNKFLGDINMRLELAKNYAPKEFEDRIYNGIKEIITELAYHEFDVIDGVEETLQALQGKYTLVVATKGDLTEQLSKFHRSGLKKARQFRRIRCLVLRKR